MKNRTEVCNWKRWDFQHGLGNRVQTWTETLIVPVSAKAWTHGAMNWHVPLREVERSG